jgi:hypothetical protein
MFFSVGRSDWGTHLLRAKNEISCELDSVSWESIYGLLEPLTERVDKVDRGGFQ